MTDRIMANCHHHAPPYPPLKMSKGPLYILMKTFLKKLNELTGYASKKENTSPSYSPQKGTGTN